MRNRYNAIQTMTLIFSALLLVSCGGSSNSNGNSPAPPSPPPLPPPPASITVALNPVFDQVTMTSPVAMIQAPGDSSRWFMVEQQGIVRVFPNVANVTNNDANIFIDISGRVLDGGERGLLGMAFHPDFGNGNFEVFFSYTRNNGGTESAITRFRSNDNGLTLDAAVEDIILTIPQDFNNHNGGKIEFGPDGYLYAGWGDGGDGNDPNNRGQDTTNLLGTFTRIDVDGGVPYSIPADNPYAANAANPCTQGFGGGDCPEIYAYGLRNPWRWSFDRTTDVLWAGDVGQGAWEEIDRIENGNNYGWKIREGAHCRPPTTGCSTNGLTDPVTEYDRTQGQSVTGGYVYRGMTIPELQAMYVYGDFGSGRIWAIPASSQQGTVGGLLLQAGFGISSFAEDIDGELYVIDYGGGVHQLVDAP